MEGIQLGFLDLFLVVAYLVLITSLGLWLSRGIKSSRDFFLAGKSLPWWAAGLSLVVSDIGAKDMVGLAGDGYRYGVVMMNFDFIGCIFPVLVAAFLFMPFLWMAGVYTVPEYLGLRYNRWVRTIFAVIWALFMMATLGIIFVSAASMFLKVLGWPFWVSVAICALVVCLYTTYGGLKAVVVTDAFSCAILIIGAALICILGISRAGGLGGLVEAIGKMDWTQHHLELLPPADHPEYPWPAVLLGLGFVLGPAYWMGNQAIVQRTLGTRSQREARASYIFCAGIKLIFPILLVLPGLIALALCYDDLGKPGEGWDGNGVLPHLLVKENILPPGVLGIVIGAFLAGVLSNLDSYVNSASTLIVTDLYRPFIRPEAPDSHYLRAGRWLVVALVVGGAAASYPISLYGTVFEAFQTFLSLFQGPLLALLLLGMLTRRTTQWGGFAGILIGVGTALLLHLAKWLFGPEKDIPILWVAWWSFVAAMAGTILVSYFTRPYDRDRLKGLVFWLPAGSKEGS